MSFGSGQCSLHSNQSSSYQELTSSTSASSITRAAGGGAGGNNRNIVYKKEIVTAMHHINGDAKETLSSSSYSNMGFTAISSFDSCLREADGSAATNMATLPLLAIVMSVTVEWAQARKTGYAAVVSNFECYCKRHNYKFVSMCHVLPPLLRSTCLSSHMRMFIYVVDSK